MADQTIRKGGCLCGGVSYRATGETIIVGVCHCRYCQLRAGSAFGKSRPTFFLYDPKEPDAARLMAAAE